ncbi:MAG: roadblock/LC7 domain-containing protein [Candidatus Odinarchaeota archaeon]
MDHSNLQNFSELPLILDELKNNGKLDGVIFAFRNGNLIRESLKNELKNKEFVSMCASVLESAVGIGEAIGNQGINKIIVELEEKIVLIFECDNNTFLIIIINKDSKISYILSNLDEIIQKIIKMY